MKIELIPTDWNLKDKTLGLSWLYINSKANGIFYIWLGLAFTEIGIKIIWREQTKGVNYGRKENNKS